MKLENLILEQHLNSGKVLVESVCQGLTEDQSRIVRGIYKTYFPLIEASLTQDQINQIFAGVEQQATAAGGNRTGLGKAVDVAKLPVQAVQKVNDIINQAGKWVQDTKPVQAFDQKFEDLKGKISAKFPNLAQNLAQAGEWAKANPGKTAVIIGVLTAVASLAGGPVGGAIAGQVLRGTAELMKGEKLSTAIGKGVKTAALGYLSGKAFEVLGNFVSGMRVQALPIPGAEESGLAEVTYKSTRDISIPGFRHREMVQGFDVIVFPQEKAAIEEALRMIENGQSSGFDYLKSISRDIQSKEYRTMMADIMRGARQDQLANDGLLKWIKGLAQAGQALSQGAVAASTGTKTAPTTPTPESLNESQIKKIFYDIDRKYLINEGIFDKLKQVGANLTTKITADKLMAAWKKAGSPMDSDGVAKVLQSAGVDSSIISQTFSSMGLTAPAEPAPQTATDAINIDDIIARIKKLSAAEQKEILALLKA